MLYLQGEEWTELLVETLDGLRDHERPGARILGSLARIGFMHMLESHVD